MAILWEIDVKVFFERLSSFLVKFERVVNGLGGWKSSVVNLKMVYQVPVWKQENLPGSSQEQKTCTFLGLKHKNAILGWDTPQPAHQT